MKIIYIFVFSFSLLIGSQLSKDEQIKQELNKLKSETIWCSPEDKLQECFDKGAGKTVYLLPGLHLSYVANIHSGTTVYIPKEATVKLADDAKPPHKGGYVIAAHGTEKNMAKNIKIYLDGTIDGNKEIHSYEKSGNEGINFKWVTDSMLIGSGTIQNCSGDGIDIDVTFNSLFIGIKVLNNSGTGLHFGSPRPIKGSRNNIVMDMYAKGNGFHEKNKRNGFDLSWPNPNGAVFINCISEDNYRNWEIDAVGGIVVNSKSVNSGAVREEDEFGGASHVVINDKDITSQDIISKKTKLLLKNELKKLIGKGNPMYVGIKYEN